MHVLMLVHILSQVWDKMKDECNIQTGPHRDTRFHEVMQRGWSRHRVRCICIHVLMHLHILIKVWDHRRGDYDTH